MRLAGWMVGVWAGKKPTLTSDASTAGRLELNLKSTQTSTPQDSKPSLPVRGLATPFSVSTDSILIPGQHS